MYGAWERTISVFYQGYTYVNQLRPRKPEIPEATRGLCWFGPDTAYTSCFVPFAAQALELPERYQTGDPQVFDRYSAWWAFDFVANWARLNYQRMTRVDILPLQQKIETREIQEMIHQWDECCLGKSGKEARDLLTRLGKENANNVVKCWHVAHSSLSEGHNSGYPRNSGLHKSPLSFP